MSEKKFFYDASDEEWEQYKLKFYKQYSPNEEPERRKKWEESIAIINANNKNYIEGNSSQIIGLNQFADGVSPKWWACGGVSNNQN